MATVRLASSFIEGLGAPIAWTADHFPEPYIDALQQAIREAVDLLSRFPAAGSVLDETRSPPPRLGLQNRACGVRFNTSTSG